MRRYIISDTHFYHNNIIKHCNRPLSHTELLVENLSKIIKREDVLYHLGDVHFGTEQQLKDILSSIKGRKYLIRGNHDKWTDTKYMICGFDGVFDAIVVDKYYLTHIPVQVNNGFINIHGHLHNLGYSGESSFGVGYEDCNDRSHMLYAPELMNYMPIHIDKLVSIYNKKGNNFH